MHLEVYKAIDSTKKDQKPIKMLNYDIGQLIYMELSYVERSSAQDPSNPLLVIIYSQKDSIKNESD